MSNFCQAYDAERTAWLAYLDNDPGGLPVPGERGAALRARWRRATHELNVTWDSWSRALRPGTIPALIVAYGAVRGGGA